jgi:hypothetical protein
MGLGGFWLAVKGALQLWSGDQTVQNFLFGRLFLSSHIPTLATTATMDSGLVHAQPGLAGDSHLPAVKGILKKATTAQTDENAPRYGHSENDACLCPTLLSSRGDQLFLTTNNKELRDQGAEVTKVL